MSKAGASLLITAFVAALVGAVVLGIVFVFADQWYARPVSPLILLIAPGAVAGGMLNPISTELYFVTVVVVQAVAYAAVAVAVAMLTRRFR